MALQHFRAKLFAGIRHFFAIHFGGLLVSVSVSRGGGPYPIRRPRGQARRSNGRPGFYTPATRFLTSSTRSITISVSFGGKKKTKHFVVDADRADFVVRIINWVNAAKDRANAQITNLQRTKNKVSATFTTRNK